MMISTDSFTRFGAIALVATLALPAQAQTGSDELKFCDAAGQIALASTKARDAGVTADQAQGLVDGVKADAQQKVFFSALISLIYAMDGVEPPLMQQVAIQMCHKRLGLK